MKSGLYYNLDIFLYNVGLLGSIFVLQKCQSRLGSNSSHSVVCKCCIVRMYKFLLNLIYNNILSFVIAIVKLPFHFKCFLQILVKIQLNTPTQYTYIPYNKTNTQLKISPKKKSHKNELFWTNHYLFRNKIVQIMTEFIESSM